MKSKLFVALVSKRARNQVVLVMGTRVCIRSIAAAVKKKMLPCIARAKLSALTPKRLPQWSATVSRPVALTIPTL
jgi:hypothetical protein